MVKRAEHTDSTKGKCPNCGGNDFHYDDFEDMYTCLTCIKGDGVYMFEPNELELPDNTDPGYLHIGEK